MMHHSLVRSCAHWPVRGQVPARLVAPLVHQQTHASKRCPAGSVKHGRRHLGIQPCRVQSSTGSTLKSDAEAFIEALSLEQPEGTDAAAQDLQALRQKVAELKAQVHELDQSIDAAYNAAFSGLSVRVPRQQQQQQGEHGQQQRGQEQQQGQQQQPADGATDEVMTITGMSEAAFGELGRTDPALMRALIAAKEQQQNPYLQQPPHLRQPEQQQPQQQTVQQARQQQPAAASAGGGWLAFQVDVRTLKLRRQRLQGELQQAQSLLDAAERTAAKLQGLQALAAGSEEEDWEGQGGKTQVSSRGPGSSVVRIVLITGFESFNVALYKQAARRLGRSGANVQLTVFSDRDLAAERADVEAALANADVFFGSLLFDYDQVEWLRSAVSKVPLVLVFESALELMGCTRIGSFTMDPSGKSKGPPPAVKKVLSLFGSGREEDRLVGYLSFLKIGPQLLRFVPGNKARDLRNWLTIYGYWNQGGLANVVSMFTFLAEQYFPAAAAAARLAPPPPPIETPPTGCLHPAAPGRFFGSPAEYMRWYEREGPLKGTDAPVVAVLLYRKHVITEQPYIGQLISQLEAQGLLPVPIFINGVEAHTIVRDALTSASEQEGIRSGRLQRGSLRGDAVAVDALVSTIGFPLVGGPAGTMEGGRQAEVAKAILSAKNIPYTVAAPLLIQDLESWTRDGIAGLQSVVLYSLPELDGAIDTVPLGGLVGDNIYLIPERVQRMASRISKWVSLRRKPAAERKVSLLLYGFPPGVGATGTAALLNVPKSLEQLLLALKAEGYELGPAFDEGTLNGEAILRALVAQDEQRLQTRGAAAINKAGAGDAAAFGVTPAAAEVAPSHLKAALTYPPEWGPTEWGPIPFLPTSDYLVKRVERQWGDLSRYRGLATTGAGNLLVPGLQLGNVFISVQPLLGIEGDPMRLLFERDLTPHPQYAAFYKWLQHEWRADAVVHFGMHGTVEWLPGAPLGNSGFSWSDVLLGDLPDVYLYACNNPSESIIAKRRGYGTIISHNVPPYGRAGLYKQLATLKELLTEYREDPSPSSPLKGPILDAVSTSGLYEDCPFEQQSGDGATAQALTAEDADSIDDEAFAAYASRLYAHLQLLESRLFSEGLHVLGQPPGPAAMGQYLSAYFGERLAPEAVEAVAALPADAGASGSDVASLRRQLERALAAPDAVRQQEQQQQQQQGQQGQQGGDALEEALTIRSLLLRNSEELRAMLRALNGEYIEPEAGGDLLRDGAGVLPTGRNIHALDPYRMPSPAALARGTAAAEAILTQHRAANDGAWPETVAVNLWGLDAIKTKGESVAMALHFIGARPVREGTGRVARFELVPLEEMGGRPRIDVLCNMSGIFRDSFQNVVELLDDAFQRAAAADEPDDMNYIAKHARKLKQQGVANAAARLFSNPAGDYGSMVNERVGTGGWESGEELGDTWAARNSYSYGRGTERGAARPEVLSALLATTERVVQQVDSVEYGLTDIQEYYANTGALKRAAQTARGGAAVGCSIVESFGREVQPRELEDVLRLEYRTKLLNPKWAKAMAAQGSGGAYEISQRMTALVGWGATVNYTDGWTWDQAAETYALDPEMAATLRASNPQAYANVLKRMLEAVGRGMWKPDSDVLQRLREQYSEMDDQLEGVR